MITQHSTATAKPARPLAKAPSTKAPSTKAPSTKAPSTKAPSTKAPSTRAPSKKAPSIEFQRRAALKDKTLPELKAMLKRNDQITTGTKTKLIKRVIECVTHGALPRCPECGLGRMRANKYYGLSCPGGFDDDEYMFCGYTVSHDEIERPAWQYETPGGLF